MKTLLIGLLSTGCARHVTTWSDPTLSDEVVRVEARNPEQILLGATQIDDPSPRSRALTLLLATAEETRVATFGAIALSDSDEWVQTRGIKGLAERLDAPDVIALLEHHVGRSDAPASTRGLAAEVLAGHTGTVRDALSSAWQSTSAPWDVAPLALAATQHGDSEALDALRTALATGELRLDVDFIRRVGLSGLAVLESLRDGQGRVEEELTLPFACARLHLGDATAESVIRRALSADRPLQRMEAVDYLAELDHPATVSLLRRARNAGPDVVTAYADLVLLDHGFGTPSVLEEASVREEREIRLVAVRVARALLDGRTDRRLRKAARDVIEAATRDAAPEVRAAAYAAAATTRGVDVAFEEGTRDEVLSVRIEAAGAWLIHQAG